jgi:transposase
MRCTGAAPACAPARASYGPAVLARAAELLCAHYLPVARASRLMASLLGVRVSTGFMAGVRHRAAALLEQAFLPRVRQLLRQVGVLHADEIPGRAAGHLEYVHVASREFLTAMHTGGRSKDDIDAGGVLPGYTGTIVRDGYAGYTHLVAAHHAWCGAHLLRDLRAFHTADPDSPLWAAAMATTLTDAHHSAQAARAARHDALDPGTAGHDPQPLPRRRRAGHHRQQRPRRAAGRRRAGPGPALPQPRRHDPALRS